MSVIAIEGIPLQWPLKHVVKVCTRIINGKFLALNFVTGRNDKTCYLRLSEMLDPQQVVKRLNTNGLPKSQIRAFIPDNVPNMAVAKKPKQPKQSKRQARSSRTPGDDSPHKVLIGTHMELMMELQSKFTGLFNLSRKTPGHSLLSNIAQTLSKRLQVIMESNSDAATATFKLSRAYRRLHPHFGDFQMILSTLHSLQDAKGVSRTHITEEELMAVNTSPFSIDNVPFDRIQAATSKYSLKITKKVLDHIRNLNVEEGGDSAEDVARRRVRKELQNLAQHLPSIIRQVIQKHLGPEKTPFHRMRIYGEPGIPGKDQMSAFTRRFRAVKVFRSDRMFNLLKLNVPPDQYAKIMAQDGVMMSGAKLIIRSSDVPTFVTPPKLLREMAAVFDAEHDPEDYPEQDDEMDSELEL